MIPYCWKCQDKADGIYFSSFSNWIMVHCEHRGSHVQNHYIEQEILDLYGCKSAFEMVEKGNLRLGFAFHPTELFITYKPIPC